MVVSARAAGLGIIETADLQRKTVGFTEIGPKKRKYSVRQLCRLKRPFDVTGQRITGRLDQDDRKSTVTQIITVTTKEENELQQ